MLSVLVTCSIFLSAAAPPKRNDQEIATLIARDDARVEAKGDKCKNACCWAMQYYSCTPFGQTCSPLYILPSQEQVNKPQKIAGDLVAFGGAVFDGVSYLTSGGLKGDITSIFTVPFSFFNDDADPIEIDDVMISQMATDTQNYVAQEITADNLRDCYDGIKAAQAHFNSNFQMAKMANVALESDVEDLEDQLGTTANILINWYPQYESSAPWNNPMSATNSNTGAPTGEGQGKNGFGIFYSVFVDLLLNGFLQQISLYGADSAKLSNKLAQQHVVDYVVKGILHSHELVVAYLNQRESAVKVECLNMKCESQLWCDSFKVQTDPKTCADTEGKCADDFYYVMAQDRYVDFRGGEAGTCTWEQSASVSSANSGSNCYKLCNPAETKNSMNAYDLTMNAMNNCGYGRDQHITSSIFANWDKWLIQPARSWATLADRICDRSGVDSNVLNTCNTYLNKYGYSSFTKMADGMFHDKAKEKYWVQQTCRNNYPGANVVAIPINPVVYGCNRWFEAIAKDSGGDFTHLLWDQGNAGMPNWTCCLADRQTDVCPTGWTPVRDEPSSDDPHKADWDTYCKPLDVKEGSNCCKAPDNYAGNCARYSGFDTSYDLKRKDEWGASCQASWPHYPF